MSKASKLFVSVILVAVATAGYVSTASARLNGQISLGKGIKCFFVPVVQPDGTIVHQQVCRKVGV